jgi:S-adenosylmethionine uptake transporter
LCGWAFFDEPVTLTTMAGTALIVGGSLVAARAKPKLVEHTEITTA